MPNPENLKPINTLPKDEAMKIQIKGGQAFKEKKLREKNFQELAQHLLTMTAPEKVKSYVKTIFPELDDKDITNRMAMLASVSQKAIKGDIKAAEYIRDTAGEKPIEKVQNMGIVNIVFEKEDEAL